MLSMCFACAKRMNVILLVLHVIQPSTTLNCLDIDEFLFSEKRPLWNSYQSICIHSNVAFQHAINDFKNHLCLHVL